MSSTTGSSRIEPITIAWHSPRRRLDACWRSSRGGAGRFKFPLKTVKTLSRMLRSGLLFIGRPVGRSRRHGSGRRSPSSRGVFAVRTGTRCRWMFSGAPPSRRALRAGPRLRSRSSRGTWGKEKKGSSSCFSRGTSGSPLSSRSGSATAANRGGGREFAEESRRCSTGAGEAEGRPDELPFFAKIHAGVRS